MSDLIQQLKENDLVQQLKELNQQQPVAEVFSIEKTKEFKEAVIIPKKVKYKGIEQEISIVFDENHTPYSIIIETDGQVHVKPLSAAFNNHIMEEARQKVRNIYDTACVKSGRIK